MRIIALQLRTVSLVICAAVIAVQSGSAQQHKAPNSAELLGQVHQLSKAACVLYVAAHPDDENTRLLAWLARGKHIRTAYLSLTRGDGGQNILGSEQAAGLGLIRTHELLEARKLDGAEQYFTRAVDFGFSKSAEETFKHWDRIRLIADVVRVIRFVRPDVMICRFPKDSMAGHGQHSASAIIAEQAFDYCHGDLVLSTSEMRKLDSMLAEPASGMQQPWKPKRLLFNAFRFGNRSTINDSMYKLTVGQYDPLLGMGYGELAGISRSLHRSQGAGTPSTPGIADEYFATLRGTPIVESIFDGIDTSLSRIGIPQINEMVHDIVSSFNVERPVNSLERLTALRRLLASANPRDTFWFSRKLREVDNLISSCMGIVADVTIPAQTVQAGQTVKAQIRFAQRSEMPVTLVRAEWSTGSTNFTTMCGSDVLVTEPVTISIPSAAQATNPYWLSTSWQGALYSLASDELMKYPTTVTTMPVRLTMLRGNDTITLEVPLSSKRLDPTHGDVIEGIRVLPWASIEPLTNVVLTNKNDAVVSVRAHAYNQMSNAVIEVVQGSRVLGSCPVPHLPAMSDTLVHIRINNAADGLASISCRTTTQTTHLQLNTIRYDHLPTMQYLEPATVQCISRPVVCAARTVGYIRGAGDNTADALRACGVEVEELDDSKLLDASNLSQYDAIVVGVRAINVRKSMKVIMPSLLAYVNNGGTLVMQYNTTQDMSTTQLGPWPLPLSRNRVTEEDAPVTILKPHHRLLTTPNTITEQDFDGWVQERGLYFPNDFDAKYEPILSMADEGEQQNSGSLLYGKYGNGHYVYCALSLFRQLPAGVAGGYRLLANMVSVGR